MRKNDRGGGGVRNSILGPALVCVLALVFAVTAVVSTGSLNRSITVLYQHPFLVSQHVNIATNLVSQMQLEMSALARRIDPEGRLAAGARGCVMLLRPLHVAEKPGFTL